MNTTTRTIEAGRYRLRISIRPGDKDRIPLVIANGAGASLEALDPLVNALDDDLEIIRFDAPGVGGSPRTALPYRLPGLAGALRQALDQLGYGRTDILGFSWGSALAQQFAWRNPDSCRRLVLVSSSPGTLMVPPASPSLYWALATPRRFHDREYAARIVAKAYGGTSRANPEPALRILHGADNKVTGWAGYYYQLTASAGWTSLPWLRCVVQPTLILAGDDDPIIPLVNAKMLNRLIPNAELNVYSGGHITVLTESSVVAPSISRFLAAP